MKAIAAAIAIAIRINGKVILIRTGIHKREKDGSVNERFFFGAAGGTDRLDLVNTFIETTHFTQRSDTIIALLGKPWVHKTVRLPDYGSEPDSLPCKPSSVKQINFTGVIRFVIGSGEKALIRR